MSLIEKFDSVKITADVKACPVLFFFFPYLPKRLDGFGIIVGMGDFFDLL